MGGVENQSTINHDVYNGYNLLPFNIDLGSASFIDQSIYEKLISILVNNICTYEEKKKAIYSLPIFFIEYYKIAF